MKKLVFAITPTPENPRNSEGAFLRAPNGDILFAYSAYSGGDHDDHAPCNIAMIRSSDEGETWSEPVIIARASDFGVKNIMSVSGVVQNDGSLGFYFLIKENNGNSTLGRALSYDGVDFTASRCTVNAIPAYYVVNNDRIIRLSDGRLAAPAAWVGVGHDENGSFTYDCNWTCGALVSDDDGATFTRSKGFVVSATHLNQTTGLQEPGMVELKNGVVWMYMRTDYGWQYESYSIYAFDSFTAPEPSKFSSLCSPMKVARHPDDTLYAIYNPIPSYNGRYRSPWGWGRTPIVIKKSTDDGRTWGEYTVIEDDEQKGFCYPGVFFTNDGCALIGYCRGGEPDKSCLAHLGITKMSLDEVK